MNLAFGRMIDVEERSRIMDSLERSIAKTLSKESVAPSAVIDACEELARSIGPEHIELLSSLGIPEDRGREYLQEAKAMLDGDYIRYRLEKELGAGYGVKNTFTTNGIRLNVTEKICPLGVLLHITAGNQYGLAFYSVVEGLLTGNINIVKLSRNDDGLSLFILKELVRIEPSLSEYIYVFDYPSSNTEEIGKLMNIANAVIVWGGDAAVRAVRKMASPNTKIIEWGHKISFAYVTEQGITEKNLSGLAENIVKTNQLLCSSCQGIYLDTESMDAIYDFCRSFLPILDARRDGAGTMPTMEIAAQNAIQLYTASLESAENPCKVFRGGKTSVTAYENSSLEVSVMHGNCWAKRLPAKDIVTVLHPYKNHLQTAALLCSETERNSLADRLASAGISRITDGANMSEMYRGGAHDGKYPLKEYTRIVSIEKMV